MGFFNPDMEDMLDVFQTESLELMDYMETYLIAEEKQRQISAEALQGIFRIVHTMKSSSAMMGLEAMSNCTHRLEDLFLIYRDAPERTEGMTGQIFDLLYAYVDYIRGEMSRISQENYRPADTDSLLGEIEKELAQARGTASGKEAVRGTEEEPGEDAGVHGAGGSDLQEADRKTADTGETAPEKNQTEVTVPGEEGAEDAPSGEAGRETAVPADAAAQTAVPEAVYQWKIHLQDDCQMENVRAFLLMKQLQPFCGQLFCTPENLQAKETAAEIRRDGLLLCFTTSEPKQVRQKLTSSVYVKEIEDLGGAGKGPEKPEEPIKARAESLTAPIEELRQPVNKMGMVSWRKVLLLQNVTGELITLANMLEREIAASKAASRLEELALDNRHLLHELESLVNSVSMMPVSSMVNQYSRAIRDICRKEDKDISFQVQGEELEVDKTLIDSLTSPLLHLIRNAADHGIESKEERRRAGKPVTGKILFSAFSVGENIFFSVSDDGHGLNKEQILEKAEQAGLLNRPSGEYTDEEIYQFIFQAGFSTSRQVTEFSGRGVGLDVVQKVVDRLRGSVYVESQFGEGTTITVSVPVSLTSVDSIQFSVGDSTCFVPAKNVEKIYDFRQSQEWIREIDGSEYLCTEELIPMVRLRRVYGYPRLTEEERALALIMVVSGMKHKIAFIADQIEGQYTIVEKALPDMIPREYKRRTGINGCAVTADGSVGFILNIDSLMRAYERGDLYEQSTSGHAGE